MATAFKYHPKQPEKAVPKDSPNLPVTPAATEQKSKKLGVQEHDLRSFETAPWQSPAKKEPMGSSKTPETAVTKGAVSYSNVASESKAAKQPTKKLK